MKSDRAAKCPRDRNVLPLVGIKSKHNVSDWRISEHVSRCTIRLYKLSILSPTNARKGKREIMTLRTACSCARVCLCFDRTVNITFIEACLNEFRLVSGWLISTIRWILLIVYPICWSDCLIVTHSHQLQPLSIRLKTNFNNYTIRTSLIRLACTVLWQIDANELEKIHHIIVDCELPASNAWSHNRFFAIERRTKSMRTK